MIDSPKFYGSATVGTKGQIVIPALAREELGLKEADKVIVVSAKQGSGLMIIKAEMLEIFIADMQAKLGNVIKTAEEIKHQARNEKS